jgi:hypothetical protein
MLAHEIRLHNGRAVGEDGVAGLSIGAEGDGVQVIHHLQHGARVAVLLASPHDDKDEVIGQHARVNVTGVQKRYITARAPSVDIIPTHVAGTSPTSRRAVRQRRMSY